MLHAIVVASAFHTAIYKCGCVSIMWWVVSVHPVYHGHQCVSLEQRHGCTVCPACCVNVCFLRSCTSSSMLYSQLHHTCVEYRVQHVVQSFEPPVYCVQLHHVHPVDTSIIHSSSIITASLHEQCESAAGATRHPDHGVVRAVPASDSERCCSARKLQSDRLWEPSLLLLSCWHLHSVLHALHRLLWLLPVSLHHGQSDYTPVYTRWYPHTN